jgi:hypothetical protein
MGRVWISVTSGPSALEPIGCRPAASGIKRGASSHARTLLALHEIAQGDCATAIARTGRRAQIVMGWLHTYNEHGPDTTSITLP